MQLRALLSVSVICAALYFSAPDPALAQTPGYITGETIVSFDPATGQLLNSYPQVGNIGPTVVSNNGTLLYSPRDNGTAGSLETLSAADGSVLSTIPGLSLRPKETRKSPSGNFIYEISVYQASSRAWVAAVDLKAGKVVHYIHVSPGYPYDLAVSPDGTKLFVASHTTKVGLETADAKVTPDASGVPVAVCPLSNGICVFDTTTFALTGYVLSVTGYLAVSQDGNSLYCVQPNNNPAIAVINTASLSVSQLTIVPGGLPARVAVAPSGNQAVVLGLSTTAATMFLVDTLTNQITGSFPAPVPAGPPLNGEGYTLSGNAMAFSRDGTSLWSLLNCQEETCLALAGQKFPSGEMIAQTPITQIALANFLTF